MEGVVARRIAYGFGSGWATDDIGDRLLRLDRQSGAVAQSTALGAGAYPNGVAIGTDGVWVGNVGTSTLARIEPLTAVIAAGGIALSATPQAIAAGAGGVWIAGRDGDVVLRLDPGASGVSQTIAVGDQPISVAVDGDTAWVGCAGTYEVWHLAHDGTVLSKTFVVGVPSDIAVGDGRVYVTVRNP